MTVERMIVLAVEFSEVYPFILNQPSQIIRGVNLLH